MEQTLRFLVWYGPVMAIVITLTVMLIYLRVHTKRQVSWVSFFSFLFVMIVSNYFPLSLAVN